MYNRSAEPRDYTRVIEALPDKLDIKRHSPGILYVSINGSTSGFRQLWLTVLIVSAMDTLHCFLIMFPLAFTPKYSVNVLCTLGDFP